MEYCEKCHGYITDRISFPLHAHDPILKIVKHKNVRKHAWKIASFYAWAFHKNGDFPIRKVLEQAKLILTLQNSNEILERKITGEAYLKEKHAKILETFFHEYEKQYPEFGKEFEILVEYLYEWSIVPLRDTETMRTGIIWFIDWFCTLMEVLPDLHREHSGGYVESKAVKAEVKAAAKAVAKAEKKITSAFSNSVVPSLSSVPSRPKSATRVRMVMPTPVLPPTSPTIPSDAIAITIKVPKYADDYVENWDDFMDQLYA